MLTVRLPSLLLQGVTAATDDGYRRRLDVTTQRTSDVILVRA